MVLIGFSGSSCSGKTSLVNRLYGILKSQGYDVAMINEVARWVFDRYFCKYGSLDELRKDSKAYLRFQQKVFDEQLFLETELSHQYEIVLTDRTLFDNILYTIVYCDFKDVYHFFLSHSPIDSGWYDIIFLCEPLVNEDCNDGFRSASDFHERFYHYKLLQNWIGRWSNVIVLSEDLDLEERCRIVLRHVERWLS